MECSLLSGFLLTVVPKVKLEDCVCFPYLVSLSVWTGFLVRFPQPNLLIFLVSIKILHGPYSHTLN
jgi:hypothetical protein